MAGASRYDRVFLSIDDLHWADADSVALVSFLCRRMDSIRFGLIASLRPWPVRARETTAGLVIEGHGTMLRLLPLTLEAAGTLLEARLGRRVPAAMRRRAFEVSAGNPLLLEQLALAMGKGADVPVAADVGMAAFGQGLLLSRFSGLPDHGMRCVQAASVLGSGFLPEVAAEIADLERADADEVIDALARSGLIEQRPGAAAEFVHPLFRQALYDDLPGPVRSRLHARAFTALRARGLDARAAEHATKTDLAGDPEAITVLESAGRAARHAGAIATAVSWLDKAAAMAGDRATIRLLMDRAEAHLVSGNGELAVEVYQMLLARGDIDARAKLEALWMLARALATTGQHNLATNAFYDAARFARLHDAEAAIEVLLEAAFCAWVSAGMAPAMVLAGQAREVTGLVGEPLRARAEADWAFYALLCGDPAGIEAAKAMVESGDAAANHHPSADKPAWQKGWNALNSFGNCAVHIEQLTAAENAFAAARTAADEADAPWAVAGLAVAHSFALFRMGRLEEALTAIKVAVLLAELVPWVEADASQGMAYILLYLGRVDESARLCEHAEAISTARRQLNAQLFVCEITGHRRLREGGIADACAAYDRLEDIRRQMGVGDPCYPPWPRHAISAYLAAGRVQDAERILAWLEETIPHVPCTYPRIAADMGRAQLAELRGDNAGAEARYQSALNLYRATDLPVEHCETLLAYGGFLRRSGWPARARPVLAQAAQFADTTGARWLAGFAHEELKVAGGRLRHRPAPGTLSAQEERVAALVATGLTNAGIARQLCLSVSTVETHLERIYAKLGIHTRYQLIAMKARHRPAP